MRVIVVGCGGSGCVVASGLPYLHQAMLVAGAEIGLNKAVVTVSRMNLFWGVHWTAVPEHLTERSDIGAFDVVIGCVDSRSARLLIQRNSQGLRSRIAYWLDLGNGADGGQFVLGQPLNARNRRKADRLQTVAELFPEIVDASQPGDDQPSCSALEALERQEPFVNQVLAHHALALLTPALSIRPHRTSWRLCQCRQRSSGSDSDQPDAMEKDAPSRQTIASGRCLSLGVTRIAAQQVARRLRVSRVFLFENEPQSSRLFVNNLTFSLFSQCNHSIPPHSRL